MLLRHVRATLAAARQFSTEAAATAAEKAAQTGATARRGVKNSLGRRAAPSALKAAETGVVAKTTRRWLKKKAAKTGAVGSGSKDSLGQKVDPEAEKAAETSAVAATKRRAIKDSLGRRLFSLAYVKRSPIVAIRQWQKECKTVRRHELIQIVKELRRSKRHNHALQICEWMTQQPDIMLLSGDYAVQLDLIAKTQGLDSAEKFFKDLPDEMRDNPTCTSLLHTYVHHKETAKAEALFEKMSKSGYLTSPLPFNRMLSLYISTGELGKVAKMVEELKKNTVPDVITYNLFLSICASRGDVDAAEAIYFELKECQIRPDWMTYSALTNLYIKKSLREKAAFTLKVMEKMACKKKRTTFSSLLSLYTNMEDKDGVRRIWKKMKEVLLKMNNAEYMCIISSFVKLGEFEEAEKIYSEWESVSEKDDPRVSNTLLAAYINNKDIKMVEKFYNRMVEKGIAPSYTTWELLTWAYLKETQMEKVLDCFKKAVASVRKWFPDNKLVVEIFNKLENAGDVEGAEQLLSTLREAGYVNTEIYSLLLKTYAKAGKVRDNIEKWMEEDNAELDEETRELIRMTSKMSASDV